MGRGLDAIDLFTFVKGGKKGGNCDYIDHSLSLGPSPYFFLIAFRDFGLLQYFIVRSDYSYVHEYKTRKAFPIIYISYAIIKNRV